MKKVKKTIEELLEEAIVPEDEQPYEVPDGWVWVRLESVTTQITDGAHRTPTYTSSGIPFISVKDIKNREISFEDTKFVSEETHIELSKRCKPQKGDILVTKSGTIGRLAVVNTKKEFSLFVSVALIKPIRTILNSKFLELYMALSINQIVGKKYIKGSSIQNLHLTEIKKIEIPLPTIQEQKRIADKVERLLSKVEEAKQLIAQAKETFELRRSAILDKAFRGELTKKWRDNNSTINKLEIEKYLGNLREAKLVSPIKSNTMNVKPIPKDDEPFDLPEGWKWARLGELSYYVTSGSRDWSKYYAESGSYFIRTQDINKNKLNLSNVAYVTLPDKVEGKRSLVEPYDLLTTITGANVGKCALVEEHIPEAYVSQSVALTKLIDKDIAAYVHLSLLSNSGGGGELESRAYGIGRPVLSLEDIKNIMIPIAPAKERKIILEIVRKLITSEEKTGNILLLDGKIEQLKNSILLKAFRGQLRTNDPREENAIKLLKEVIQEQVK